MSAAEIERLRIATLYLEELGLPVWVANIGDGLLYRDERSARGVIAQAQSLVAQLQKRAGLPQFAVTILESTFGLHGNIIFVATNKVALQFGRSSLKKYLGEHKGGACRTGFYRVKQTREDWASVRSYYSKERTEEAHAAYGHLSDHYTPGVHRLGQGGGDRVRLSRALDRHLLDLGLIEPYRRTNSRKLTSINADARPLERVDRREATAPAEHGAIVAPPPAPVDERRDVAGIVAVPAREASDLGCRLPAGGQPIQLPWLAGSPGPIVGPQPSHLSPAANRMPVSMLTTEIADLTKKQHRNVLADTRKMLIELHGEGGLLNFQQSYRAGNGKQEPCFRLPQREVMATNGSMMPPFGGTSSRRCAPADRLPSALPPVHPWRASNNASHGHNI